MVSYNSVVFYCWFQTAEEWSSPSKPCSTWSKEQTEVLVELWRQPEIQNLRRAHIRHLDVYELLAAKLHASYGYGFTGNQVRRRIYNLRQMLRLKARNPLEFNQWEYKDLVEGPLWLGWSTCHVCWEQCTTYVIPPHMTVLFRSFWHGKKMYDGHTWAPGP